MSNKSNQTEKELAKSKAAKTAEEMQQFAEEEDTPLSLDDLEQIAGGYIFNDDYGWPYCFPNDLCYCEHCGSRNGYAEIADDSYFTQWKCRDCGRVSHYKGGQLIL